MARRRSDTPDIYYEPESGRAWVGSVIRGLALIVLGVVLAVAVLFILDRSSLGIPGLNLASGEPSDTPEPVTVPEENAIARQAEQWGVSFCLARTVFLSQFLTQGMTSNWLLTRGMNDANRELFAATIVGLETGSNLRGISNLYAAPVRHGGCNSAYETTLYVPASCAQAREAVFPTFTTPIELGSNIAQALTTSEGTARLFLMPAGETGCVAVKSELFY